MTLRHFSCRISDVFFAHRSPGDSVTGFEICVGCYPHILKPLGSGIIGNMIRIPNKMVPSESFFQSLLCTNGKE